MSDFSNDMLLDNLQDWWGNLTLEEQHEIWMQWRKKKVEDYNDKTINFVQKELEKSGLEFIKN